MGSAEVFLAFAGPLVGPLRRVARRYTRREEDASDLVQETLLRAWRSFSPAQERAYRRSWLFTILRNVALEWRRSAQERLRWQLAAESELTELVAPELGEPFAPFSSTIREDEFREQLDRHLAAALDSLKGPYREVLILSVAGELTYREIAETLDCPIGTVMSRMARARRALREHLASTIAKGRPARVEAP